MTCGLRRKLRKRRRGWLSCRMLVSRRWEVRRRRALFTTSTSTVGSKSKNRKIKNENKKKMRKRSIMMSGITLVSNKEKRNMSNGLLAKNKSGSNTSRN